MKFYTIPYHILLFMSIVFLLVHCNKKDNTAQPTRADANQLFVALNASPTTLDPQETSATITAQITNSIYDPILSIVDTWTVSEDFLTWDFTIKPNIFFHHATKVQAEDVVATIQRLQDPKHQSPFLLNVKNIDSIESTGELSFRIVLKEIDSSMPTILKSNFMSVLPADLIKNQHNFTKNPIGTGPFIFSSWERDLRIELSKNDKYHGTPSNISGVVFFIMPDIQVQVQAIIRGDVDVVPYIIEPELSLLKKQQHINTVSFPGSTVLVLAMNTRRSPMDTLEFRKAVAQAIDKQKIIDVAYPGSKKSNMFWYSSSKIYKDIPDIFDINAAKQYIRSNPVTQTITISVPSIYEPHVRAAQVYQSMLENVGITTEIQQVDWGTWLSTVYGQGDFDMTVIGHTGKLTPGEVLEQYAINGGYVGWNNEEFSSLIQNAKTETDQTIRNQLYTKALTIMTNEYPFVIVGENTVNFAVNTAVQGLRFDHVLETYDFREVSITR